MRRAGASSSAVSASLSEFAFILLFISAAAAVIIFGKFTESLRQIDSLEKEVLFLEEILAEKEGAIVPCWKRPDSPVPEIAGTLTVLSASDYSLYHHEAGTIEITDLTGTPEENRSRVISIISGAFKKDIAYAESKNCYVRVRVINNTNDYTLYKNAADLLKDSGLVVINE